MKKKKKTDKGLSTGIAFRPTARLRGLENELLCMVVTPEKKKIVVGEGRQADMDKNTRKNLLFIRLGGQVFCWVVDVFVSFSP